MVHHIAIVVAHTHKTPTPTQHTYIYTTSAITQISWSGVSSGPNRPGSVFCVLFHLRFSSNSNLAGIILFIILVLCLGSCLELCALKSAHHTARTVCAAVSAMFEQNKKTVSKKSETFGSLSS